MSEITLDPRLESILHDIASDPRAHLLRPDPVAFAQASSAVIEPPTAMRAGLTAAERELVRAYRDELAFLLRRASFYVLRARRDGLVRYFDASGLSKRELKRTAERERAWRENARLLVKVASPAKDPVEQRALDLLRPVAREEGLSEGSALALASASLRLRFTPAARLHYAGALLSHGQPLAGSRWVRSILVLDGADRERSLAWERIAASRVIAGHRLQAAIFYGRAARCGPPRVVPAAAALLFWLQSGEKERAKTAAAWLADRVDARSPVLRAYLDWQRELRNRGLWGPTEEARQLVSRLASRFNGSAEEVFHVVS